MAEIEFDEMTELERWEAEAGMPEDFARQQALEEFRAQERDTAVAEAWQEQKQTEDLQAGLAAYYNARKQGEQEAAIKNKPGKAPRDAMIVFPPADDPPPWWKKLINGAKKIVDDGKEWVNTNVVQPAKTFVTETVTTAKETYETVKRNVKQKWEDSKEWIADTWVAIKETSTVLGATVSNAWRTLPETAKKKIDYIWNIGIKGKPVYVPAAQLSWDPALPDFHNYIQNQYMKNQNGEYILPTHDVECVTTSAVDVRNMVNDYLANLTGEPPLPYLNLQDYINATDMDPDTPLPVRFPTNQSPILGIPIAGWMHPRVQLLGALEEFSQEFDDYYGYSFDVRQTSFNTLDDIAIEIKQGHLVIVRGMGDPIPDSPQEYIGGSPHTMGPVIEINPSTNKIVIMDTNGHLTNMDVNEFLKWWKQPSLVDSYTDTNTMTVIIPDAPTATQPHLPVSTPLAVPAQTPAPSVTSTSTPIATNTPASATNTPTQTPMPTGNPKP